MRSTIAAVDLAVGHWLALVNTLTSVILALPFIAPALLRAGLPDLANLIYSVYQVTCHEWPFRSYFLFGPQATYSISELEARGIAAVYDFRGSGELGYKVAFCERNVAIYGGLLIAGLVYGWKGHGLRGLSFRAYSLASIPMVADGLSQLSGLRESSWELRTLTGVIFGFTSAWLIYPRLSVVANQIPHGCQAHAIGRRLPV